MDNKLLLSGVRVLLVDEEDALTITRLMLELYGAEVVTAPAAAEGLEKGLTHAPDVIVSDISMPQMDGYQFIRTKFACA
jgi:CheY-like chemotaxis protein